MLKLRLSINGNGILPFRKSLSTLTAGLGERCTGSRAAQAAIDALSVLDRGARSCPVSSAGRSGARPRLMMCVGPRNEFAAVISTTWPDTKFGALLMDLDWGQSGPG